MVKTARPGRLGNGGERWWPESGKTARFGHLGPSLLACVDEENEETTAELVGYSPELGGGRSGEGRRWPAGTVSPG
jgi:hypothetical protein